MSNVPVLDILRPVKIENWREDGLFRRSKYGTHRKIKFIIAARSSAFDYTARNMQEARSPGSAPKIEIITDKMMRARARFNAVEDAKMREIMCKMILRVDLLSARDFAKLSGYAWPQFVLDFNLGLDQAISDQETRRAK